MSDTESGYRAFSRRALDRRATGGGSRKQMRAPAAQAEQRPEYGHGDAQQSRKQTGNGVGVDALLFEPVHRHRPDRNRDPQSHPADRGYEIAAQAREIFRLAG